MSHLAKCKDERDGDEDGDEGGHERVEEYGQRLHGERVADEERAEEQVLVLNDGEDPGCARGRGRDGRKRRLERIITRESEVVDRLLVLRLATRARIWYYYRR